MPGYLPDKIPAANVAEPLLQAHVPGRFAPVSDNNVAAPTQVLSAPMITPATGCGNTFKVNLAVSDPQQFDATYSKVSIPPWKPETTPSEICTDKFVASHIPGWPLEV